MEPLHTFEIKDQFYLDGNPFRIISGGMHYFRVLPEHWEDRLLKLKALGCNTVETVVPWNLHEPKKGEFDFTGEKLHGLTDLVGYVKLAQKLGLWVILRPSPYICAEWEFGGFPAWLACRRRYGAADERRAVSASRPGLLQGADALSCAAADHTGRTCFDDAGGKRIRYLWK